MPQLPGVRAASVSLVQSPVTSRAAGESALGQPCWNHPWGTRGSRPGAAAWTEAGEEEQGTPGWGQPGEQPSTPGRGSKGRAGAGRGKLPSPSSSSSSSSPPSSSSSSTSLSASCSPFSSFSLARQSTHLKPRCAGDRQPRRLLGRGPGPWPVPGLDNPHPGSCM